MSKTLLPLAFAAVALSSTKVDAAKGIIKGVSVITSGITAKGHNLEVDMTTLRQMKELAMKKGKVPVKWNHKTGADAVNGYLQNFRISGRKLLADWHLLKTHPNYDHAIELAEKMPESVGLSASFMGENESKGGKHFARCEDLISVDLVATAAANPDGLFSALVDTPESGMAQTVTPPANDPANKAPIDLAAILSAVNGIGDRMGIMESRMTNFEAAIQETDDDDDYEEEEHEDPAGGDGTQREFKSLNDVVHYFEAQMQQAAGEQERQELEALVTGFEHKFGAMVELNEQLAEENKVLALALKELQAKTKSTVNFSAGSEDGEGVTRFEIKTEAQGPKKNLTEFETRVEELKKEGKKPADAMLFAVQEDQDRYERHLNAKGAIQSL